MPGILTKQQSPIRMLLDVCLFSFLAPRKRIDREETLSMSDFSPRQEKLGSTSMSMMFASVCVCLEDRDLACREGLGQRRSFCTTAFLT